MHLILRNKSKKPRQGLNNNNNKNNNSNNNNSSKKTIFSGTFTHESDENYEEFLKQIGIGWFERQTHLHSNPRVTVHDNGKGLLKIGISFRGLLKKSSEKSIVIGDQHLALLPNGEHVKAVTVRECDSNLITRIRRPNDEIIEIRQEYSEEGFKYIIRMEEYDLESIRYFKRIS